MAIQAEFYPSSNDNIMLSPFCNNNGYNFAADGFVESCFNSQQKQHHHHIQQQQQKLEQRLQQLCDESQRPIIDPNVLVFNPKFNNNNHNNLHHHSSNFSPSFGFQNQFEMQREQIDQQIDQYIILQNAKLRHMIQEQGKQQVAALLRKVECRSLSMLREKDQEIAQATKKRLELEEYLTRLEAENQAWQRMAQENEAMALSLNKTLEDMRERGSLGAVDANDAESCCDESNEEEEEKGIIIIGENNEDEFEHSKREMMMVCKSCNFGKSCCLFLPCRHLSSCKDCDAFLQACPVCRMPKKASIETLIF